MEEALSWINRSIVSLRDPRKIGSYESTRGHILLELDDIDITEALATFRTVLGTSRSDAMYYWHLLNLRRIEARLQHSYRFMKPALRSSMEWIESHSAEFLPGDIVRAKRRWAEFLIKCGDTDEAKLEIEDCIALCRQFELGHQEIQLLPLINSLYPELPSTL